MPCLCKSCSHRAVCKLIDIFEAAQKTIDDVFVSADNIPVSIATVKTWKRLSEIDFILPVKLTCKYFVGDHSVGIFSGIADCSDLATVTQGNETCSS